MLKLPVALSAILETQSIANKFNFSQFRGDNKLTLLFVSSGLQDLNKSNSRIWVASHWEKYFLFSALHCVQRLKACDCSTLNASRDLFFLSYFIPTALHWAVISNNHNVIRTLLKAGASMDVLNAEVTREGIINISFAISGLTVKSSSHLNSIKYRIERYVC